MIDQALNSKIFSVVAEAARATALPCLGGAGHLVRETAD